MCEAANIVQTTSDQQFNIAYKALVRKLNFEFPFRCLLLSEKHKITPIRAPPSDF